MADHILLNCSVLGRELKGAIRAEKTPKLDHLAASDLDIRMVSERTHTTSLNTLSLLM